MTEGKISTRKLPRLRPLWHLKDNGMTIALRKSYNHSWLGESLRDLPSLGLSIAILIAFTWLCTFCALTLFNPVLDFYGFRQTQTALNVYSMLHDHVFFAYLTPVLAAPCSVPFEAPVYQAFVAALVSTTGLDLDASGRVVSVAFFLGSVVCGYKLVDILTPGDSYTPKLFLLFALVSPLYVFW